MRRPVCILILMMVPPTFIGAERYSGLPGAKDDGPVPKAAVPEGPRRVTRPARGSLDSAAAKVRSAVFAIGGFHERHPPEECSILGTGVLVSRKRRLIATAAHIADCALEYDGLLAVPDGTVSSYRVTGVWYHPCVNRMFDVGLYAQSTDPTDGEVALPTYDLALLQLAEGGPVLPQECALLADEELLSLGHNPVGHLGFPSEKGADWPTGSRKARATLATGVISRQVAYTSDGYRDDSAGPGQQRWVRSTASLGRGASGGPLFLENGCVIALYSGASATPAGVPFEEFVRVDALRDVLRYHGLQDRPSGTRTSDHQSIVARQPSGQELERLRRAVKLVREAERSRWGERYHEASDLCNEAIQLVPGYAWAYLRRAEVYIYFCEKYWRRLSQEERCQYSGHALEDMRTCLKILPEWQHRANLLQGYANLYVGLAFARSETIQENVEYLNGVIDKPWRAADDEQKAELLNLRAFCRERLCDFESTRADYDESIRLGASEPRWYLDRARFWTRRNRPELADRDKAAAERLFEKPP